MKNPFPGPQPYRESDRKRFFGREDMAHRLGEQILGNRCVTVYGPSGAGKSSLLQAAVFPALIDRHDIRLVRVDGWPAGEEALAWLASALQTALGLEDPSPDVKTREMVLKAARGAARSSPRLFVIYLDQLEQLLFTERPFEETQPFFDCIEDLLDLPLRNVRVVLSLREDYLGRFRDRLRDLHRIMEHGFRVGSLTVSELTESVVLAAAAGEPPQTWSSDEMRALMLQVRVPGQSTTDQAEAQSAYAQIICRALFQERAAGKTVDATEAEPILRNYLASTLAELGTLETQARQLLEDHLVSSDGSRTLRTEKELAKVIESADLGVVLQQLEGAAILRAEAHHGTRYFEIGHDWLARKVFEERAEREALAEQKRIEEEQARQLVLVRAQQRRLRAIAAGAMAIAALVAAAAVVALIARSQAIAARNEAQTARNDARASEQKALWERDEANDLRLMAGYLALQSRGNASSAMKLLAEVKKPELRSGWVEYANAAIEKNALWVTLQGHRAALRTALFSPDGQRILTASGDFTARIWNADGTGQSTILSAHQAAITSADFSPESKADSLRVLTTSADGNARISTMDGSKLTSITLSEKAGEARSGAWSPDGQRVAVASVLAEASNAPRPGGISKEIFAVRVYSASDGTLLGEHKEHRARINAVVFLDNTHVLSASDDETVRVWDGTTKGKVSEVRGHSAPVLFVEVNRERGLVVTASADAKTRVFKLGADAALTPYTTLGGHTREVLHAAISHDGKFVATASSDRTARVWNIEEPAQKGKEVVLDKHDGPVTFVAFQPGNSNILATASSDHMGRIFRLNAANEAFLLSGHAAPIKSIVWNPKGDRVLTAAFDTNQSASADHTARIWYANAPEGKRPWITEGHFQVASIAADGHALVAAYDDASVAVFDKSAKTSPVTIKAQASELWGLVSAVASNSDGSKVALASLGKDAFADTSHASSDASAKAIRALHLYDKSNWEKPIKQYEVEAVIRHLAWDNAGQNVVAALENAKAMVFRPAGEAPPFVLQGHTNWLTSASFSPDGQKIVTASLDKSALVFDANATGPAIGRFEHPAAVYAATFDPSGQRIATACADGKVRVFDVKEKTLLAELDAKIGMLHRIAWSKDGMRIAAASLGGAIVLWSNLSWPLTQEARPLVLRADSAVAAFAFIDGSSTLVAAAANRSYGWKLDLSQLKTELSERNRDCLGVGERTLYLNESFDAATQGFNACEQRQQRPVSAGAAQTSSGAEFIVARVVVWPASAEVEMDGVAVHRRDGFVEVWGKAGDKKKLRVADGAFSTEVEIAINPSGAKPSVIDLDANRPAKTQGETLKKLGEGLDVFINPDKPEF